MKFILSFTTFSALLLFGFSGTSFAADEIKACTGHCTANTQCKQTNGNLATCGSWSGGTCLVNTTDQAKADHTCKCVFEKTYTDGCSSKAPLVTDKATPMTKEKSR